MKSWKTIRKNGKVLGRRLWEQRHVIDSAATKGLAPKLEYSGTSSGIAIIAAAMLGAKTIHVFGMDLEGRDDWDGYYHGRQNRGDNRWKTERNRMVGLFKNLQDRGIKITRVR